MVKAPSGHHRTGGLFEVNVHLALPNGRQVDVDRTPPADERHADLTFAINDAFKHARRQLQEQVDRLQGTSSSTPAKNEVKRAGMTAEAGRSAGQWQGGAPV